jgi:hypothetical protein
MLPDQSDFENLDRELDWLLTQTDALEEKAEQMTDLATVNRENVEVMGTKFIFFAVAGLMSLAALNWVFFTQVKKTFKDRKLI